VVDIEAGEGTDVGRVVAWIERHVGGRVTRIERQPRWRPAWFADVERDGSVVPLYVRGDRGAAYGQAFPLEQERTILQVLEAYDIPVPHVYGMCPDPLAIVMERVPGRVDLSTADDEAERRSVLDHYVELLARMHAIPAAEVEALGIERPTDPTRLARILFDRFEAMFRADQRAPEPFIDFLVGWVRRNVPRHRSRAALIACDSGQFVFDAGRVTSMLDFDSAHLGDPLVDLASMRTRDLSEPLGDLRRAFRRYEDLTGEPIDRAALDFHTVQWTLCTPMSTSRIVHDPPPGSDPVLYLEWYVGLGRVACQIVAERLGIDVDREIRTVAAPVPRSSRHTVARTALVDAVADLPAVLSGPASSTSPAGIDDFGRWRLGTVERLARYLRDVDERGPALDEEDAAEAAAVLGRRPTGWAETEVALVDVVRSAGPERDAELVRFFARRLERQWRLIEPVSVRYHDRRIQVLDG
jgi:aminoglycoside phosphotransferase (APT) family kinase protein